METHKWSEIKKIKFSRQKLNEFDLEIKQKIVDANKKMEKVALGNSVQQPLRDSLRDSLKNSSMSSMRSSLMASLANSLWDSLWGVLHGSLQRGSLEWKK